jgi:hypothetical protein
MPKRLARKITETTSCDNLPLLRCKYVHFLTTAAVRRIEDRLQAALKLTGCLAVKTGAHARFERMNALLANEQ